MPLSDRDVSLTAHLPQPCDPLALIHQPIAQAAVDLAHQAQASERQQFTVETGQRLDEDGRLGLALGNSVWAAVNGPKGEWR